MVCGGVVWKVWQETKIPEGIVQAEAEIIEKGEDILQGETDLYRESMVKEEVQQETQEEAYKENSEQQQDKQVTEEDLIILQNPQMYTYEDLSRDAEVFSALYPEYVKTDSLGKTADGRELWHFVIGDPEAEEKILINGGIHGREYMTSQLVMKQMTMFLKHLAQGDSYQEQSYEKLLENRAVHVIPMVNPDGISISQLGVEGVRDETMREKLETIAQMDGQTASGSYLTRWKANGNGVDLNRNFEALWEEYQDPAGHPSSDHYKGESPGCEIESAALIELTQQEAFSLTISYHTQGSVIYWYFAQEGELYEETMSFGERISLLTGYSMDANYEALDPAGYKDWAISKQGIPSLTIEVGTETSPVPYGQFEDIWRRNEFVWEETLLESKK